MFLGVFFMLFCNFLRINPQLLVQKLRGHNYTISEFAMPFCRWEKHSKFWERIINEVFILPVRFMPSINGLLILPVKFTQNWQNKQRHFYSTSNIARRLSKSIVAWKIHMGRSRNWKFLSGLCAQRERVSAVQAMQWFNDPDHKSIAMFSKGTCSCKFEVMYGKVLPFLDI